MEIDDILITEKKPYQETLRERLDILSNRVDLALICGLTALVLVLLLASKSGD